MRIGRIDIDKTEPQLAELQNCVCKLRYSLAECKEMAQKFEANNPEIPYEYLDEVHKFYTDRAYIEELQAFEYKLEELSRLLSNLRVPVIYGPPPWFKPEIFSK